LFSEFGLNSVEQRSVEQRQLRTRQYFTLEHDLADIEPVTQHVKIDYGCYVDLINTGREPKALFEADEADDENRAAD